MSTLKECWSSQAQKSKTKMSDSQPDSVVTQEQEDQMMEELKDALAKDTAAVKADDHSDVVGKETSNNILNQEIPNSQAPESSPAVPPASSVAMDLEDDVDVPVAEQEASRRTKRPRTSPPVATEDASEKASTKASKVSSQVLGQKKQSKSHSRYCKGCDLWYVPSSMGSKSSMCLKCKHAMDNLSRAAAAEGQKQWVTDLRSDPERLQCVIKKYKEIVGTEQGARTRMPKGSLLSSLSKISSKSRILMDTELEMMSEDQFLQHSSTDQGGRLSKSAAQKQWRHWEEMVLLIEAGKNDALPEDLNLIFDRKKGFLRIAVSTRDTVHLQNDSWIFICHV